MRLVNCRIGNRRRRRDRGLAPVFGEGFAWEKNGFFRDTAGCGGTGGFWRAMVKATLRGTTGFETTGLAAAIIRAALIAAAVIVAPGLVAARFAALRGCVFGRREVATADVWALRASAAMAPPTAAPASAAATITTTISAAAVILAAAIAAGAWRVILRGIVVGRKILRRRGVRIGLALFRAVMSIVMDFGSVSIGDFAFRSVFLDAARLLVMREGIVVRRIVVNRIVVNGFVRNFFAVSLV